MACVYVLQSKKNGKFYVGSTREENANIRLNAHNRGKTRSTKVGRPWVLIYEEKYETYTEARKREHFLKSGVGRQFFKQRLAPERRGG